MLDIFFFGFLRGAVFALAAFGFSLVLGVLGIVNLAHGVFIVLGASVTYALYSAGTPIVLAALAAAATTGLLGMLIQRLFIDRVFNMHPLMVLVQTFGVAIIVSELANKAFGTSERLLRLDVPGLPYVEIGSVFVPTYEIVVFVVSLVSAGLLVAVLNYTSFGRAVRACRDSRQSAELVGINVPRVFLLTMGICGAWAGLAGALILGLRPTAPHMHFMWTIEAFLVVIIGGLGSMGGALVGGFLYGVLNFAAYYYWPSTAPAVIFGALIVMLMLRPAGLFGLGTVVRK
ncbi:MAG: branched-chain amino acid ABC transporter permease [Rhodobacteraceae bacterium]|jgi:branched-chain amino acid transport system permease protein|nr:branched-chain amino acid ABC transporter permease [Paracoccaceae bacterium]